MPSVTPNFHFYLPLVNNATDQDLWGGYLNDNWSSVDTLLLGLMPAGSLLPYAGTAAPSGFLLCYGQAVSRATYAALFAVISTTYGAGDGTTTFNLPDLRGRGVIGKDNMGGSTAGRITNAVCGIAGTTLGATGGDQSLQIHSHTLNDPTHSHALNGGNPIRVNNVNTPGGAGVVSGGSNTATVNLTATDAAATGMTADNAGSGNSQNVQPGIVLNVIIKT